MAIAALVAAVALAFVTAPARAADPREERAERASEPVLEPASVQEERQDVSRTSSSAGTLDPVERWEPADSKPKCCKICRKGCPCGDTCISCAKTCRVGPGCACSQQ